ncbi:molybdopterin molybdotransferase MoeA [Kordiimonas sp. SCSIO 12603]|uniref:molybdopterin molybdotransferase MoeA n=1 Tax=Kordiimonas sp. SCSIO 12603 TaxID=2829596 RepID=UPI0021040B83|nr:gephyrin-like molybdotransferase Glp [Kordiimonas sp. SCSIO 12603]UTW57471.1 molybdopterin molybdotransferase MoeA [Kordiimonas sp. SCSIO 12603]
MISVEEAFARIVTSADLLTTEKVSLQDASGRVLVGAIKARRSQPASDVSAMDGYAVNSSDLTGSEVTFTLVGTSAAGEPFNGAVKKGEAVRIFTGAPVPAGANQVVIQENTGPAEGGIFTDDGSNAGKHIRMKGYDFSEGQIVLEAGTFMTPKSIGLAASSGHASLMVYKAPTIAILATGDELASPDADKFEDYQTVNSISPQLNAFIKDIGAEVLDLGHAGDSIESLKAALQKGRDADVLVTIGGASVGDRDFMQQALSEEGMTLDFWKVAMRPGKPLIYGKNGKQHVLGLPGNPVSAFVCAYLYLRPLIDRLMGRPAPLPTGVMLPVATDLPTNGTRQDYMRARLIGEAGNRHVDPAVSQDSGHTSVLANSDGLIVRAPNADPVKAGDLVPFLPF